MFIFTTAIMVGIEFWLFSYKLNEILNAVIVFFIALTVTYSIVVFIMLIVMHIDRRSIQFRGSSITMDEKNGHRIELRHGNLAKHVYEKTLRDIDKPQEGGGYFSMSRSFCGIAVVKLAVTWKTVSGLQEKHFSRGLFLDFVPECKKFIQHMNLSVLEHWPVSEVFVED